MKDSIKVDWVPEFLYEEGSQIPFVNVPPGKADPVVFFVSLVKETGEVEPGADGEDVPIYDMELAMYASMQLLKASLTESEYSKVRSVLGFSDLTR